MRIIASLFWLSLIPMQSHATTWGMQVGAIQTLGESNGLSGAFSFPMVGFHLKIQKEDEFETSFLGMTLYLEHQTIKYTRGSETFTSRSVDGFALSTFNLASWLYFGVGPGLLIGLDNVGNRTPIGAWLATEIGFPLSDWLTFSTRMQFDVGAESLTQYIYIVNGLAIHY